MTPLDIRQLSDLCQAKPKIIILGAVISLVIAASLPNG
jgi:hypothetical protein